MFYGEKSVSMHLCLSSRTDNVFWCVTLTVRNFCLLYIIHYTFYTFTSKLH